jgi:hypothetical protein
MKKIIVLIVTLIGVFLLTLNRNGYVRGKFSDYPMQKNLTIRQTNAQTAALNDRRVKALIGNHHVELFGTGDLRSPYQKISEKCAGKMCQQVNLYDFDAPTTIVAIVDSENNEVLDVLSQPFVRPLISQSMAEIALEIALNDVNVEKELGFRPKNANMAPADAGLIGTICDTNHLCVAATFEQGNRNLWALVDLTEKNLVGLAWTELKPNLEGGSRSIMPVDFCPKNGIISKEGWDFSYAMTNSDGLDIYDVKFNGVPVLTSAKTVEWHADYGIEGFVDSTGCGFWGSAYPISPYGETQIVDLVDQFGNISGFQISQDARMLDWGKNCNYRYEQRFQFFRDGSFNILNGSYGRGCGSGADDPIYSPVMRIDLSINGDDHDLLEISTNGEWKIQSSESWWDLALKTIDGWQFRDAINQSVGYEMQPVQAISQTGVLQSSSNGYLYLTQHLSSEGDVDLGTFSPTSNCCFGDYRQGPEHFVDGDLVRDTNVVVWYVPQMQSNSAEGSENCWTVQGEPNPITYPCFGGLKFTPIEPIPTGVQLENSSNSKQIGMGDSLGIFLILVLATFIWLLVRIIFPRS